MIGLLMTGSVDWLGGIHYLDNLARGLRSLPQEEQPRLVFLHPPAIRKDLVESILPLFDRVRPARSGSILSVAKDIRSHGAAAWRERPIGEQTRREGVDLLFPVQESLGPRFPVPWVGWIPDFQHSVMPEFFGPMHRIVRSWRFRRLIRDATRLVLSSKVSLQDMKGFSGDRWLHKTRVLHFTCVPSESWFEVDPAAVREKYHLKGPYFFVPNQFWVHKNHRDVFEAVKILSSRGREVLIVCTGRTVDPRHPRHFARLVDYAKSQNIQEHIRVLGMVPRGDQIALLRGCRAVVQPSRFEGWSTVVEEARALGRPLIASSIPVHHEQAHPMATYFDPGNPEELAEAMWGMWGSDGEERSALEESSSLSQHTTAVLKFARRFLEIARDAAS